MARRPHWAGNTAVSRNGKAFHRRTGFMTCWTGRKLKSLWRIFMQRRAENLPGRLWNVQSAAAVGLV